MCTGEPRCQEDMLKRVPKVAERADLSVVETDLVPRINQLCLATTNAGVRVAALSGLAALAGRLPKDHALRSLSTIHKVPRLGTCAHQQELSMSGIITQSKTGNSGWKFSLLGSVYPHDRRKEVFQRNNRTVSTLRS